MSSLLLRRTGIGTGADPHSVPSFARFPASLESGTLELRSPGVFTRWLVDQYQDKDKETATAQTGMASAVALWVPNGCTVDAVPVGFAVDQTPASAIRRSGVPASSYSSGTPSAAIAAGSDNQALVARFWPGMTPAELYAMQPPVTWAGDGSQATVPIADASSETPETRYDLPALTSGTSLLCGYTPGFCNRVSVWCEQDTILQVHQCGQGNAMVSPAAKYHELSAGPWDQFKLLQSSGSLATFRFHFWRQ